MTELILHTDNASATVSCGRALSSLLERDEVLVLSGDLGAGKTCLTKGIAEGLGVAGPVTSPTFNILLVHEGRLPLYHFDLYRLDDASQLEDIDYWGTLEAGGVSVVEWGERFAAAQPRECLVIRMRIVSYDGRAIALHPRGAHSETLAARWAEACLRVDGVTVERVSAP